MGGLIVNPEQKELQVRHIEESVSRLGAKVADAVELSQKAKELSANSETLLINVQQALEELYVSIDESIVSE